MIAYKIKELLTATGKDKSDLGNFLGRDSDYVRRLLMGIEPLTAEDLFTIADFLGVPMWALIPDTEEIPGDSPELTAWVRKGDEYLRATTAEELRRLADKPS